MINKLVVRGWKHGLIKRAPKKNYSESDLSSLRDISLLSCVYRLFMKCLIKRITPRLTENGIGFWQRAYLKKWDRQELIFCVKTAMDDFKHMSSKFYDLFIDFRDAFGSLDQNHMIKNLSACGIEETYCKVFLDIYQDSHFVHKVHKMALPHLIQMVCQRSKEKDCVNGFLTQIFWSHAAYGMLEFCVLSLISSKGILGLNLDQSKLLFIGLRLEHWTFFSI